jgi:hypothetical protein
MIIINQDKNELVNFDNIMCINITNCEEDGYLISAGFVVGRDDNYRDLGYYNKEIVELTRILEHILSDYKRVLKENELLRQQNISYKNNIHELKKVRNK